MKILSFLKRFNWFLILPAFLLTFLGLLSIYSISSGRGDFLNFKKQIIFLFLSLFLIVFLSFFDLRFLKRNSYFVLILYFLITTAACWSRTKCCPGLNFTFKAIFSNFLQEIFEINLASL